jgi:hypothetical protein
MSHLKIGIDYDSICSINSEKVINTECIDALQKLRELGHTLVCFCEDETKKFLATKHVDKVFFVKKCNFKNDICLSLGLDVLIDSRLDTLESLTKTQSIWFNKEEQLGLFEPTFQCISWEEVLEVVPSLQKLNLPVVNDITVENVTKKNHSMTNVLKGQ